MDPVCHTLAGAALAETGIKRRTRLGAAALMIGANIPDLDVLAMFLGNNASFAVRRGLTHGVLGLLILPLLLASVLSLYARMRPSERETDFKWLLVLSYAGTLTHPLLDLMNVYGVRLLMPFSDRWFYGDVLFIVDPILWLLFGWGVATARKKRAQKRIRWGKPAKAALVLSVAYIALMAVASRVYRADVLAELEQDGIATQRIMVGPVPLNPFRRWVVATTDGAYRVGMYNRLNDPRLDLYERPIPAETESELASFAARDPAVRRFLVWARFPFVETEAHIDGTRVMFGDARYTIVPEGSWATTETFVEDRPALGD